MTCMDPKEIVSKIKGIAGEVSFPAHKDDVVQKAQEKNAPNEVMDVLDKLPSQNFGSLKELVSNLPFGDIADEAKKFL